MSFSIAKDCVKKKKEIALIGGKMAKVVKKKEKIGLNREYDLASDWYRANC